MHCIAQASMTRFAASHRDPRNIALHCWGVPMVLVGLGLFLWNVHRLTLAEQLLGGAALVAVLWWIGSLTQPRETPAPVKAPVPIRR